MSCGEGPLGSPGSDQEQGSPPDLVPFPFLHPPGPQNLNLGKGASCFENPLIRCQLGGQG